MKFLENELLPEHQDAAFCLFRLIDHNAFAIVPFSEDVSFIDLYSHFKYNPLLMRRYDFNELSYTNLDQQDTEDIEINGYNNLRSVCNDSTLAVSLLILNFYI